MASASSAIVISGLWVAIIAVQIFSYLDHSGTMDGAQAPLLDAAVREVVLSLAAIQAFFTAVTFIYVHIHNGGGGGASAGNQWIPEVVTFILSVSIGLLEVSLFPQPGANDDSAQAPSLGVAAVHALLPSATVTFFLGARPCRQRSDPSGRGAPHQDDTRSNDCQPDGNRSRRLHQVAIEA